MTVFYAYVLQSMKDNRYYYGYTSDLEKRQIEHNRGIVKSTRHRRPLHLIYSETFLSKNEAMDREKFFKSGKGREFLKSILDR
jgi:putative endonuclease